MQKIVAMCGAKQSGKTSSSNFLHGYELKRHDKIKYYHISDDGNLYINTLSENSQEEKYGRLDVNRSDFEFVNFAQGNIWSVIKSYHLADYLKEISINLFGLTTEQCFGDNEQKNSLSTVKWADFKKVVKGIKAANTNEFMTAREVLQYFGTEVCRAINPNCWTEFCINQILVENVPLAIICDVRFENEVKLLKQAGAKVIKLTKKPLEDSHASEKTDDIPVELFDKIIDNQNMTIQQKNQELLDTLYSWGYVG